MVSPSEIPRNNKGTKSILIYNMFVVRKKGITIYYDCNYEAENRSIPNIAILYVTHCIFI